MVDTIDNKSQLSVQVLKNAVMFKDNSVQLYADATNQVRILSGEKLYPPESFPKAIDRTPKYDIRHSSDFVEGEGQLTEAEAVAAKILLDEGSAMAQSVNKYGYEADAKILERLDSSPQAGFLISAVEGFSNFGNKISTIALLRESILHPELFHDKTKMPQMIKRLAEKYIEPLKKDEMKIGVNCARKIAQDLEEIIKREEVFSASASEHGIGESEKTETRDRVNAYLNGVKKASGLYLESLEMASHEFKSTLS